MARTIVALAPVLVAAAGLSVSASSAMAQWIPDYQIYTIQRIGLFGPEQTGSAGLQFSTASFLNTAGQVAGFSNRYTGVNTFNGRNTWVYNPVSNTTVQRALRLRPTPAARGCSSATTSSRTTPGRSRGARSATPA